MDAYLGQIMLFAGGITPANWMNCDGTRLAISEYPDLFKLIGATFGGDGTTNYLLPNLVDRVPVGMGSGAGLTPRKLGDHGGYAEVTLSADTMPAHTHQLYASSSPATTVEPSGAMLATTPAGTVFYLTPPPGSTAGNLDVGTVGKSGGGNAHPNLMPYLGLRYLICVNGFPPTPKPSGTASDVAQG